MINKDDSGQTWWNVTVDDYESGMTGRGGFRPRGGSLVSSSAGSNGSRNEDDSVSETYSRSHVQTEGDQMIMPMGSSMQVDSEITAGDSIEQRAGQRLVGELIAGVHWPIPEFKASGHFDKQMLKRKQVRFGVMGILLPHSKGVGDNCIVVKREIYDDIGKGKTLAKQSALADSDGFEKVWKDVCCI